MNWKAKAEQLDVSANDSFQPFGCKVKEIGRGRSKLRRLKVCSKLETKGRGAFSSGIMISVMGNGSGQWLDADESPKQLPLLIVECTVKRIMNYSLYRPRWFRLVNFRQHPTIVSGIHFSGYVILFKNGLVSFRPTFDPPIFFTLPIAPKNV